MTKNALKIIADGMAELNLEYGFPVYQGNPIVYPYFVGEYIEQEPTTEDGLRRSTFILNGFTRSTWLSLEDAKEAIEQYFTRDGTATMNADGSACVVAYAGSMVIPTGEEDLKRIQVNLSIQEWMVN